jgi:hypothetical protein
LSAAAISILLAAPEDTYLLIDRRIGVCTEAASNGVAGYAGQKQELCQNGTTCEQNQDRAQTCKEKYVSWHFFGSIFIYIFIFHYMCT